ncbi:MAG: HEAT repeat domain-containing protein [Desulfovibrio sp.]|nr:HEAT repeat domain-containing protein [Desulfovibrio sp.]
MRPPLDELIGLLSAPKPIQRVRAIRQIVRLALGCDGETREVIRCILEGLGKDDQPPFVLWHLALALGQLGDPHVVPVLEQLAGHEHANVRFRVAVALGLLRDPSGLALLQRLAQDPYQIEQASVVRQYATWALGLIGEVASLPILAELTRDPDPVVRWHAAVAIGDIGDPKGTELLIPLLNDPIPFVRGHAALALAEIGDTQGLPPLEQAAKTENHPKMRLVCERARELLRAQLRGGSP